jgi:hypothetical protein
MHLWTQTVDNPKLILVERGIVEEQAANGRSHGQSAVLEGMMPMMGPALSTATEAVMHVSELDAPGTYTPDDTQASFMDEVISPATLKDGSLQQRFDPMAFPQVGVTYTGTDSDGNDVPAPAVAG